MPEDKPRKLLWQGKPVEELTKKELLAALYDAAEQMELLQQNHARDREMLELVNKGGSLG